MSDPVPRDTLLRYSPGVRTNHWLVAIAFVLAALSGLAIFHPALFWLSNLFGGGPWTRILHPFIGLFMVLAFFTLAASVWDDNRLRDADWQWLGQWRDVVNNREERLPEVGRYNGGQ
jgi:formate dehydrogenase subunit gamma